MKKVLAFVLAMLFVIGGCALAENDLIGMWLGTGYEYSGMMLDPCGEWIEFETDTRGKLFIANEYPFDYTIEGDTIRIHEDVGIEYEAQRIGDEIILNTGMLYHFARDNGEAPAASNGAEDIDIPQGITFFNAISCELDGESYETDGEYLVLYSDGTGIICFEDTEYEINWTQEDTRFSFTDETGDTFIGIASDDMIGGVYSVTYDEGTVCDYEYVFKLPVEEDDFQ